MSDREIIEECTWKLDKACAESYNRLENYYLGHQPINYIAPEVRKQIGRRLSTLHLDWPRVVLRSHENRVDVIDFRLGNEESFKPAWDIWQRNNMDEVSSMGHLDAFLYGRAFVSVWVDGAGQATMRCESPKQTWVEHDPADGEPKYAIKRWYDWTVGKGHMLLLTPDKITKYVTTGERAKALMETAINENQEIANLPPDSWTTVPNGRTENPTGRVPIFPLVVRGRLMWPYGESILVEVLPVADAINKLATDMMVSAEYHAMPRRWATGVQIIEDEDGNPEEAFSSLKGRTWTAEAPDARIGSLPEADLKNFIDAIEMLTTSLSAMGCVPPHYIDAAKGSLASADSIRASESALVSSVRRAEVQFGGAWEDAMRYALSLEGKAITPDVEKMEVRWRDPENTTLAQLTDAAIKRKTLGVPTYQLWEDMGYTTAQISRMKKMQKEEARNVAGQGQGQAGEPGPGSGPGQRAFGANGDPGGVLAAGLGQVGVRQGR